MPLFDCDRHSTGPTITIIERRNRSLHPSLLSFPWKYIHLISPKLGLCGSDFFLARHRGISAPVTFVQRVPEMDCSKSHLFQHFLTLEILGKESKSTQKSKENSKTKKARKTKKTRIGRSGQLLQHDLPFQGLLGRVSWFLRIALIFAASHLVLKNKAFGKPDLEENRRKLQELSLKSGSKIRSTVLNLTRGFFFSLCALFVSGECRETFPKTVTVAPGLHRQGSHQCFVFFSNWALRKGPLFHGSRT